MGRPSESVVKTLFALSCNTCAFPGCEERLTDPGWLQVKADIAHISGDRPGSARYDPTMTDEERQSFQNLVLLCPNHHRHVDRLEPERFSVADLRAMKAKHEERCGGRRWADEDDLAHYAFLALSLVEQVTESAGTARLVIESGVDDRIIVTNVGDADARAIRLEPLDGDTDEALLLLGEPPARLSPGGRWQAGQHVATFGNAGPHTLRVEWQGPDGAVTDAEFPL